MIAYQIIIGVLSMGQYRSIIPVALCATGVLAYGSSSAQNNLVQSIMKLRGEVEALYSQIDQNKEIYKTQIKSLAMQKADNEAQINRQETALALLDTEIASLKEKLAKQKSNDQFAQMVMQALDQLEATVRQDIPFKKEERLQDIAKIRDDLASKRITSEKALARTWASYDDLLRLTKEIGLFKQTIKLNGKAKQAQIAKIGTMMLFFKTPDEQYGYVAKKGSTYSYVPVMDEAKKHAIALLFDQLKKQIRTGYFTLPNALLDKGEHQ